MLGLDVDLRGEEVPVTGQNGDVDVVAGCDLVHACCEFVVEISIQGVKLLGLVEGDDGDFAAVLEEDAVLRGRHDGCGCEKLKEGYSSRVQKYTER